MPLAYQTSGEPAHPPYLFLHGLGSGANQTISALAGLPNRYLIAPDMPGHGESINYDPATFSFDNFADHTIELMDHLGIESTDLGGLSMGSGISLNIALRYPERARSLTILRPSWLDQPQPSHLGAVGHLGDWLLAEDRASAMQHLETDPDFVRLSEANPVVAQSVRDLFNRPDREVYAAVLVRMWDDCPFKSLAELRKITIPSLVLSTTRDELHPQVVAEAIAASLPDARSDTLPARYYEPEAYLAALTECIQRFLSGLPG